MNGSFGTRFSTLWAAPMVGTEMAATLNFDHKGVSGNRCAPVLSTCINIAVDVLFPQRELHENLSLKRLYSITPAFCEIARDRIQNS